MAVATFQEAVHALADDGDSEVRGLRFRYARERPDHAGVWLSWPQVAARARGVARRLADAGVGGGEVVAVHAHDQLTALAAVLGAMWLGAVPTVLAPLGAGVATRLVEQFHAVIAAAAPRVLI